MMRKPITGLSDAGRTTSHDVRGSESDAKERSYTALSHWINRKIDDINGITEEYPFQAPSEETMYEYIVPRRLVKNFANIESARKICNEILEGVCHARWGRYNPRYVRFRVERPDRTERLSLQFGG